MHNSLLKELADFTDLRKKHEGSNAFTSRLTASGMAQELDFENNELILKSFRELR
jgi:uncharacterized coiled-coil protein SlyX